MRWLAAVASVWAGVLAAMSLAPSAADASQPAIVLPLDQEFGDPALWELVGSSPPGSLTSADGARRAGVGASVAGLAPHHHARLAQVATDLALYGRLSQADPVAVAWCEGLAFGALIHASRPSAIDAPPTDLVAALDEEVARRRLRTLGGFLGPLVSRETLLWDLAAQVAPSAPEPLAWRMSSSGSCVTISRAAQAAAIAPKSGTRLVNFVVPAGCVSSSPSGVQFANKAPSTRSFCACGMPPSNTDAVEATLS